MSFPPAFSQAHLCGMPRIRVRPRLALTMPATVALPTPFLMYHRVTAALGTQIARHTQMAQAQRACCLNACSVATVT